MNRGAIFAALVLTVLFSTGIFAKRAWDERRAERAATESDELHTRGLAEEEALRYDSARDYLRRALELRRALHGDDHPKTREALHSLARLAQKSHHFADEMTFRLEIAASLKSPQGDNDLAVAMNALGMAQGRAGELAAAEASFERAFEIFRAAPNPERSKNLLHTHVAWIAELQGQASLAESGYRRVLRWWEIYLGHDHPRTAWTVLHLAYVVAEQGRLPEAERLLRRALAIHERAESPVAEDLGEVLYGLGRVVASQGRRDEARALLERSLEIRRATRPADHPDVVATEDALAALGR